MPKGGTEGPHLVFRRPGARPRVGPCRESACTPWWPPGCPPSPIYLSRPETPEERTLFHDLASVPPPPRFRYQEHQKTSSRHPTGGRIHLRELLHHHGRFPDEP